MFTVTRHVPDCQWLAIHTALSFLLLLALPRRRYFINMWKVSTKYRLETKAKGSTRYRNPRGSHIEHERVHLYYQQDNQHASHTQITSIPLHLLIPPFLFLQLLYMQLSHLLLEHQKLLLWVKNNYSETTDFTNFVACRWAHSNCCFCC